ncbi:15212_t:CDS:1, partial [Funneliformis geosporum]
GINVKYVDFEGRAKFEAIFCDGCSLKDDHGKLLFNKNTARDPSSRG